ncbi:dehalogenase [Dehalogenimonas etheniformans]|uniref:Dehalogenase n=1 Tax=Dehalogenimonas etheniformans TaxID=1536648 RepID=A0A2P5P760_9CHLR|nr:dehalogenase [Dehalogenimonas etheniformans]PPD58137.1 dehalogenase [Dehalogenimonas etheniformans]QNT75544.1 dehalogenase [Dehalogenimonas etheniformans]
MWLVIGLVLGALLIWLVSFMKSKGMAFRWYEWIIGIIGLALLLFTIQNYFGSQAELEPKAANMFLLVTGLPAVIFLAITWQLVIRHKKTA